MSKDRTLVREIGRASVINASASAAAVGGMVAAFAVVNKFLNRSISSESEPSES